jgi:hypothetical protein
MFDPRSDFSGFGGFGAIHGAVADQHHGLGGNAADNAYTKAVRIELRVVSGASRHTP